ncbi:MAG: lysophospholipid acyltransferase family protein [Pseudomonadota bacterium]
MPQLRALAANIVFYMVTIAWMLVCIPLFLGPSRWVTAAMKGWARTCMVVLHWLVGIRWEVRGLENLPRDDTGQPGFLLASKHQSVWETFGLLPYLDGPIYILKKELMAIPFYGWFAAKAGMIPVERSRNAQALRDMTKRAKQAMAEDRQIIIFPEGTRRPVDAEPAYKSGIAHLYRQLDVPVVPVALNSGLFWPRRQFARYPGTLVLSILPPIDAGGEPRAMLVELEREIEAETTKLVTESRAKGEGPR